MTPTVTLMARQAPAGPSRLRRAGLVVAGLLLALPTATMAASGPDPDRLPSAPRCADASAVTRVGAWVSVRGPGFVERPLGQGRDVTAYVVSPHDPLRVFATNGTSIMGSRDSGCTWRELYVLPDVPTDENPMSIAGSRIERLVVPEDARAQERVLAVVNDIAGDGRPHVLVSTDGTADSFERKEEGLPQVGLATDLAVAPTNPDFLWLSVRFASGTGGGGPTALPTLPPLPPVPGVPPAGGSQSPTSARGALYASVDGGASWQVRLDPEDAAVTTGAIEDLVTDPLAANQLWAVSGGVLRHSSDAGRTFRAAVPTPAEQASRGWRVTTLVVAAAPGKTRTIKAFTATSAQNGGPRLLTSTDGGATFDEVRGPGPVDAAVLVGPEQDLLAVSTAPTGGTPAKVLAMVDGAFTDLTPTRSAAAFALSTDRTRTATLHVRLPDSLLRYVGPLVTPPAVPPPVIGGLVDNPDLPRLGTGAFLPASDDVELAVGASAVVPHVLDLPRRGTPLDLYVLLDTTLSMQDDLPAVRRDVLRLTDRLRARGIDLRIGLGEFKGQESAVGYRRVVGIGPSLDDFRTGLASLKADGSGLEMQLIALEQALDGRGETAADLVPATCKATDGNPDRFLLDERRTTPPVPAGQEADFQPSHAKAVLVVTDTTFLRPAGTRLTPDCRVDTAPVAAGYRSKEVHVVGVGIDDVDNPRTAEDLNAMAAGTDVFQPAGRSCAPGLVDRPPPVPAVCRSAAALDETLVSLVATHSEPASLGIRSMPATTAVRWPALPAIDLRRPSPVSVPVTYTCGNEPGEYAGVLEASVAGLATDVVARLPWRLRCLPAPAVALPPEAGLGPPTLALLPTGTTPPPPAPAQAPQVQPQTQVQSQPQVQSGTQEEEQAATELALVLQEAARQEGVEVQAMTGREDVVPAVVRLGTLTVLTMVGGAVAVRRRQHAHAVVRVPVGGERSTRR